MSVTTEKVIVQVSVDGQVTLVSNISSALGAASSAAVAEAAAAAALVSETNADASEAVAVASAAAALISENNSAASESAAAASELAALNSKNAASTSESNALTSANNADISEAAAAASAAAALVSQNAAAASASSAATSTTTLVQGGTLNASFASIKSSGDIVLAGTKKFYVDGVGGVGGDTYLMESSANVLDFFAGAINTLKLTTAGAAVIGTLSASGAIAANAGITVGAAQTVSLAGGDALLYAPAGGPFQISTGGAVTNGNLVLKSSAAGSTYLQAGSSTVLQASPTGVAVTGTLSTTNTSTLRAGGTAYTNGSIILQNYTNAAQAWGISNIAGSLYVGYNDGSDRDILSVAAAGVAITPTKKLFLDGVAATGDTYLVESSANVLDIYAGGIKAISLGISGAAVLGTLTATHSGATPSGHFIYANTDTNVAFTSNGTLRLGNSNATNGNFTSVDGFDSSNNVVSRMFFYTADHVTHSGGWGVVTRNGGTYNTKLYIDPDGIASFSNITDASSTTVAALKTSGGLGVAKNIVQASTMKHYLDGGSDTYLVESSANVLDIYAGGVNVLKAAYAGGVSTVTVTGNTIAAMALTSTSAYSYLVLNNSGGATKAGTLLTITGDTQLRSESISFKNYDATAAYASFGTTGAVISSGRLQVSADAVPPSNYGVEIGHNGTTGAILSYNRTTAAYKALNIDALSTNLQISGSTKVAVDSSGATITGNLSVSDSISVSNSSISAIDRTVFGATITDAFIYDTSKDSDGGAWRKRCAHTSWENETLSGNWLGSAVNETAARAISGATTGSYYYDTTAAGFYTLNAGSGKTATYRGNVRQFPAKVLITVEAARVVLWDLTQAGCPMWMVFNIATSVAISCATMLNGLFVFGSNGTTGYLWAWDFPSAKPRRWYSAGYQIGISWVTTIPAYTSFTSPLIVSNYVNDVAMTVLPNAPVDVATGLPVPTIAVATEGGVSVIQNDGTVTSKTITQLWSATLASSYKTNYIAFTKNKNLVFNYAYNSAGGYGEVAVADTSLTVLARYGADYINTTSQLLSIDQPTDISGLCALAAGKNEIILGLGTGDAVNPPGTGTGLGIIHDNPATVGSGLYAEITKNYNSGWQVGAIKGAWLADTVAETLTGTELVTDGDFASVGAWSLGTGFSVAGGKLVVASATLYAQANRTIATVAGKSYTVAYTLDSISTGSASLIAYDGYVGGTTLLSASASVAGRKTKTFIATSTQTVLALQCNTAAQALQFDDFSCRLADVDRSIKSNGLQAFGSLTKAAVASGASLMGYSGFSAANYLEQPYNSDLDFGTGDFCIMGWVKEAPNSANEYLYHRAYWTGAAWSGPAIVIYFNASGTLAAQITDDAYATVDAVATSAALDDSVWRFACLVRRTTTLELWINGVLVSSTTISAAAASLSNTSATCAIGRLQSATSPATNATKALWRTGATAPSAEQIKHIYETEKELFNASANCCLAGTSNAVTALAYDDETDLLHVGTSYGRSAFKGLVRVSSEATPVGAITALAASGGFIAQGGATGADIYVPAYTLREELLRSAEQIAKMGSTLEPIWTTATASQTAFQMNVGWQPKYVYRNGLVLREGATEDYSISFDGFRWTVTLADASIVGDNICIMGVRTNG